MVRRERRKLDAPADEEPVGGNEEGVGSIAYEGREGRLDLAVALALRTGICNPRPRAASGMSRSVASAGEALAGSTSTAMRTALGARSCNSPSRLATASAIPRCEMVSQYGMVGKCSVCRKVAYAAWHRQRPTPTTADRRRRRGASLV